METKGKEGKYHCMAITCTCSVVRICNEDERKGKREIVLMGEDITIALSITLIVLA